MSDSKEKLITLLQNAYSGEKAAALAYLGHSRSVKDADEKKEIKQIEKDEWDHRECIGKMLEALGSAPRPIREFQMTLIGCAIYFFCKLGYWCNFFNFGWFASMYGAGKLEQGNIIEYEIAAYEAIKIGRSEFVEDLIHMAEVEWDHEKYFREKALTSKWSSKIKIWKVPPPRDTSRKAIEKYLLENTSSEKTTS